MYSIRGTPAKAENLNFEETNRVTCKCWKFGLQTPLMLSWV